MWTKLDDDDYDDGVGGDGGCSGGGDDHGRGGRGNDHDTFWQPWLEISDCSATSPKDVG